MADYHPLIARAVAGLEKDTAENRRALYERARTALVMQLRGTVPALEDAEITRERLALEEAIRKVEVESARRARETPKADPQAVKRAADAARREETERAERAAEAARREDAERTERIAEATRRDEAEQAERAAETARCEEAERSERMAEAARREEAEQADRTADAVRREEAERTERAAEAARRDEAEQAAQKAEAARRVETERAERAAEAMRREDAERAERMAEAARREEVDRFERAMQVPPSLSGDMPTIAPEVVSGEPAREKKSVPNAPPAMSWSQSEPGALLDEALREFREVARSSSAQSEAARQAPPARPAFLSPIPISPPPAPLRPIAQPFITQPSGQTPPLQPGSSPLPGSPSPDPLQALESFESRFSQDEWQTPPGEHVRPRQMLDLDDPNRRIPPYQASAETDEDVHTPRSLRSYRWLVWILVVFAVVAGCTALGYWQGDAIVQAGRGIVAPFRGTTTQAQRTTTPAQSKIPDRIGQPDSTPPVKPVVVTAARAMLTTEPDANNPRGRDYVGSANWRTETIPAAPGRAAEVAIKLDVEIPDRGFAMTWTIRRNTDATLPASHTIDIEFNMAANSPLGRILEIKSLLMKQPGQVEGSPLWGHAQKSTPNYFLVGLSAVEADAQYNLNLLKGQPAFDVALVFSNVRRTFLLVEKGTSGDRVFADAFAAWKQ